MNRLVARFLAALALAVSATGAGVVVTGHVAAPSAPTQSNQADWPWCCFPFLH